MWDFETTVYWINLFAAVLTIAVAVISLARWTRRSIRSSRMEFDRSLRKAEETSQLLAQSIRDSSTTIAARTDAGFYFLLRDSHVREKLADLRQIEAISWAISASLVTLSIFLLLFGRILGSPHDLISLVIGSVFALLVVFLTNIGGRVSKKAELVRHEHLTLIDGMTQIWSESTEAHRKRRRDHNGNGDMASPISL